MNTTIQGQVGPQTVSDGTAPSARMEKSAALVVTELHGKYAEQNYRGNLFWATMTAGVIFPAPGATANNPITLFNPAGSTKNLNLISFDMVFTIIPGTPLTGLYGLYINNIPSAAAVTGTTLVPIPGLLTNAAGASARPLTTSTLPAAPTLLLPFAQKVTGEVATVVPNPAIPAFHIDFDGKVIISPGSAITPQQTVADTTNGSVICCFCWEEVPV